MHFIKHRSMGILLLPSLLLAVGAEGAFEGDYKYAGYNIGFHGGVFPSNGEAKEIFTDFSDITVTSSNTFSGTFTECEQARRIENLHVTGAEPRVLNAYSVAMERDVELGGGTVTPTNNLMLLISPDGEEEILPFYFSSDTNVAMLIEHGGETNGPYSELGFGLLIQKGSGMDETSIDGTYIRYTVGNASHGTTSNGWGNIDCVSMDTATLVFDGAGNYTANVNEWVADRTTTEVIRSVSDDTIVDSFCTLDAAETNTTGIGTYSLDSDGTMLISSDIGMITNQISPDGNVVASALCVAQEGYAGTYFTIAVKQPENRPTNAIDAVYFLTEFYEGFFGGSETEGINYNSLELGRTYIFLNADGTFSLRSDYWGVENTFYNQHIDPGSTNIMSINVFQTESEDRTIEFSNGTYSIETNGIVTLAFDNGDFGQAQLSANGEFLVTGFSQEETEGTYRDASRQIIFGIRRNPPPPAPGPVVFNNDIAMTSTGLVMTATMPANYTVEGLSCVDLAEGAWYSGGSFSTATGTVEIHDPNATNAAVRFYSATFMPW